MTMRLVAIAIVKAQCFTLLEEVARTGEPLVVTRRGKPLARVTASDNSRSSSPQETLWHTVETLDDIIAPAASPEAWNAYRGVVLTQDEGASGGPASGSAAPRRAPRRTRRRSRA
jgi:prevent-host-death family protein